MSAFIEQFAVADVWIHHVFPMCHEEIFQNKLAVFHGKTRSTFLGYFEKFILSFALCVIVELDEKRGDEIKIGFDGWKFIQKRHHVVIVFGRMQPDPRELVAIGQSILVKRLMLVPEK